MYVCEAMYRMHIYNYSNCMQMCISLKQIHGSTQCIPIAFGLCTQALKNIGSLTTAARYRKCMSMRPLLDMAPSACLPRGGFAWCFLWTRCLGANMIDQKYPTSAIKSPNQGCLHLSHHSTEKRTGHEARSQSPVFLRTQPQTQKKKAPPVQRRHGQTSGGRCSSTMNN